MNTAMPTATHAATARAAIGAILAGDPPNGAQPADLGEWWPAYAALAEAHATGSTPAARAAWGALCNATPGLAALVAGEPEATPRYVILTAAVALEPQPPIVWIVEGIFSAGSVSLLAGEPGSGKTFALLDCGVSVALGQRWLGYAVTQCPVLIVDEESGPRRLKRRLGDVLRGHDASPTTPPFFTSLARFDLWQPDDVTALQSAIVETGARFVVVDALADLLPGRDENSVKDMQPGFMALRAIAEATDAALVVIHHLNKSGGYRGSTAIKGAVDLLLTVEKSGDVLTFKSDKARDVEAVAFASAMNFGPDMFNLSPAVVAAARPTFTKSESYVLRYLQGHGQSPKSDIENHADVCTSGTARNALYALTNKGYCKRIDDGAQGNAAIYALTTQGEEAACNV